MQEYVIALAHGAENFYDGELLDKKAFVASCNDSNTVNGSTPYDVAAEAYGEEVLKKLQLRRIDLDEVKLSPKLIRNN